MNILDILLMLTPPVLSLGILFRWAFRRLPEEGFQVLAALPQEKTGPLTWVGLNLTYYGLFQSMAAMAAVTAFLALMGSVGVSAQWSLCVAVALFGLFLPASSLLARTVEGRSDTLTVGGASFVGVIASPLVVTAMDWVSASPGRSGISLMPALAALATAYALGEGIGRLACISFGCCYGKPIAECGPLLKRLFGKHSFVFLGNTKKIAYDGGLEGAEVIPIQAITALVLVSTAFIGALLFLSGRFSESFLVSCVGAQSWRVVSEFLRADYRGGGRLSMYQLMALLTIVFAVGLVAVCSDVAKFTPSPVKAAQALWDPWALIGVQIIGIAVFLHAGRSKVTGSVITVHCNGPGKTAPGVKAVRPTFAKQHLGGELL